MKILQLTAENVKRLKVVQIKPDGNLVEISGKNGAGKTSVLDSIWWAMSGTLNVQAVPIRRGAEKAVIKLDLGEVVVTRTFHHEKDAKTKEPTGGYTTTLTVESPDGKSQIKRPQEMLNGLWDALSVDPLAFSRKKPEEQFDALKRFLPGVDFKATADANKADFAERTTVNRQAKEYRAQLAAVVIPEAPAKRADSAHLVALLEQAGEHNAEIERRKARRERVSADIQRASEVAAQHRSHAASLRRQADEEDRRAAEEDKVAADLQAKLDAAEPLPEPVDTAKARETIATAEAANALYDRAERAKQERDRLTKLAADAEAKSAALTKAMDDRDEAKRKAISEAVMPVEDVGFGDGEILLNGLPFNQASDAEQLRASIAIAMASNPKLRVLRVRDGSLLDSDSMQLLAAMATERDYQVWIETVQSGSPTAVHLVDGEVAP